MPSLVHASHDVYETTIVNPVHPRAEGAFDDQTSCMAVLERVDVLRVLIEEIAQQRIGALGVSRDGTLR